MRGGETRIGLADLLRLICISIILAPATVAAGAPPEKVLGVAWVSQHKDTYMLCLEGCPESGNNTWDAPHLDHAVHGDTYCARAATAMIANYFLIKQGRVGERLSQDRISYEMWCNAGYPPDYALGHGVFGVTLLDWALNAAIEVHVGPSFEDMKGWIVDGRPMVLTWGEHCRVVDGYRDDASGQLVHLLNPWPLTEFPEGNKWVEYGAIPAGFYCVVTPSEAPDVRSDEDEIWMDSDNDGIVDFDEIQRFGTDPYDSDSDGDAVSDKEDIRGYVFDRDGNYGSPSFLQEMREELTAEYRTATREQGRRAESYVVLRYLTPQQPICPCTDLDLCTGDVIEWHDNQPVIAKIIGRADFDGDGLRKELDPDSDNDGLLDGEEDLNHNGIFEPELGETSNFNSDRISPITTLTVGDPKRGDTSGILFVSSATGHTLSVSDMGPGGHPGILATYYRYYPAGTPPPAYSRYAVPFELGGADGFYVIEYYSQDTAGNTEIVHSEMEYLDDLAFTS